MGEKEKYWLALSRLPATRRREAVLALGRGGTQPSEILRRTGFDDWAWVERELKLLEETGARIITFTGPDYPPLLREIYDPPLLLYARGRTEILTEATTVAIVGTRRPTIYGSTMAETLARGLASMGVVIASGMARGCDAAAHRGALDADGATVAVLGTGVDVVYPVENKKLYDSICERGLVLSELPLSTPPRPYNFPRRNRIISGISTGVVVVEAPLRSGAMTTARVALEQSREVFAVPGPVTSYRSRGANRLIKEGAHVAEDAPDILAGLGITALETVCKAPERTAPLGDERLVFDVRGEEPLNIDELARRTGLGAGRLAGLLVEMELKGLMLQRPGKNFSRRL